MAELVLGSRAFGIAARARRSRSEQAAAEVPILVGCMAEELGPAGMRERHKRVSVARARLASCDMPPLTVCW